MSREPRNDSSRSDVDRDDGPTAAPISGDNIDAVVDDDRLPRLTDCAAANQATNDGNDSGNAAEKDEGDICRICHMGEFPGAEDRRGCEEEAMRAAYSQLSTISTYAYLGALISACKCRGTVGLVHAECLERWLTESGHTTCELCGHKYATRRVPRHNIFRSLFLWVNTVIATRQMLLDILYLIVTTPLAIFSCYICLVTMRLLIKSGIHDVPWMIVAILPTCFLTLAAYWGWLITLGRLHGRRWRRYWRSNFVIRLLPENANTINSANSESPPEVTLNEIEENVDWRDGEEAMVLVELF